MMTTRSTIAAVLLTASLVLPRPGLAAEDDSSPPEDPIEAAIRAFNERGRTAANEVVVVLDPPTDPAPADPAPEAAEEKPEPVLVTGRPRPAAESIDIAEIPVVPTDHLESSPAAAAPKPGLAVRVETVQTGHSDLDTSQVNLLAPFPAKPLMPPPSGWRLETSKDVPPFKREVELAPGKHITLTIHPHLLVPEADGIEHFAVPEPGFQASLGYQQSDTVAGVLSKSIEQLDQDSKQLGTVIDRLQELIVTLPRFDEAPKAEAVTPPAQ